MAATDITLTNANVNSGVAVILPASKFTFAWKNITKSDPIPGKYDISESHFSGFESPRLIVRGAIDINSTTTNVLTLKLLVDFAACKSGTTTLKVSLGVTPVVLGGRPSGGYNSAGANTLDTTNGYDVQIDNYSFDTDVGGSKHGERINYSISLHETG